jgi:hypothetical protein
MSFILNPTTSYPQYGNLTVGALNVAAPTSASGYTYTNASTSVDWSNGANPVTITQKATIDLKGEGADITINGESLSETLKEIKQALRLPSKLAQDPKLEEAWSELQAVGEHYNRLLKEYREKQKVWDTLKDDF